MGRVAIVTGGSRGIGEAISIALRDAGVTVVANYAGNEERARAFTERTGIKAYKWDVADFDACQAGVAQIESELGAVDAVALDDHSAAVSLEDRLPRGGFGGERLAREFVAVDHRDAEVAEHPRDRRLAGSYVSREREELGACLHGWAQSVKLKA